MAESKNNLTVDFVGNIDPLTSSAARAQAVMAATNQKISAESAKMAADMAASASRLADIQTQIEKTKLVDAGKTHEAELLMTERTFDKQIAAAATAQERGALITLKSVTLKSMAAQQETRIKQAELDKQVAAEKKAADESEKNRKKTFGESLKDAGQIVKAVAVAGAAIEGVKAIGAIGTLALGGGRGDSPEKLADDYTKAREKILAAWQVIPLAGPLLARIQDGVIDLGESIFGSPVKALEEMNKRIEAGNVAMQGTRDGAEKLKSIYEGVGKAAADAASKAAVLNTPAGPLREAAERKAAADKASADAKKTADDAIANAGKLSDAQKKTLADGRDAFNKLSALEQEKQAMLAKGMESSPAGRKQIAAVDEQIASERERVSNAGRINKQVADAVATATKEGAALIQSTKEANAAADADYERQRGKSIRDQIVADEYATQTARAAAIAAGVTDEVQAINMAAEARANAVREEARKAIAEAKIQGSEPAVAAMEQKRDAQLQQIEAERTRTVTDLARTRADELKSIDMQIQQNAMKALEQNQASELAALNAGYDAKIEAARRAGNEELVVKLDAARKSDIALRGTEAERAAREQFNDASSGRFSRMGGSAGAKAKIDADAAKKTVEIQQQIDDLRATGDTSDSIANAILLKTKTIAEIAKTASFEKLKADADSLLDPMERLRAKLAVIDAMQREEEKGLARGERVGIQEKYDKMRADLQPKQNASFAGFAEAYTAIAARTASVESKSQKALEETAKNTKSTADGVAKIAAKKTRVTS